jgi:hypothetical protein
MFNDIFKELSLILIKKIIGDNYTNYIIIIVIIILKIN